MLYEDDPYCTLCSKLHDPEGSVVSLTVTYEVKFKQNVFATLADV